MVGACDFARVVRIAEQEARALSNGDDAFAHSGLTLSISLAALDADLNVARDDTGPFLIMDGHELLISDEALKNPSFDPRAAVDTAPREQAFLAEQRLMQGAATTSHLNAAWGGAAGDARPLE